MAAGDASNCAWLVDVPQSNPRQTHIEAFTASGTTRVALARQLGKGETEIRRMLDPYHKTKISTLEAGLRVLGKRLVISVEAA